MLNGGCEDRLEALPLMCRLEDRHCPTMEALPLEASRRRMEALPHRRR